MKGFIIFLVVVAALYIALSTWLKLKQYQTPLLLITSDSVRRLYPRHSLKKGFRPCNPSVALSPDGKQLWMAYRETNVCFQGTHFLKTALGWRTGIGIMILDPATLHCLDSYSLDVAPPHVKGLGMVQGYHDPRIFIANGEIYILAYRMRRRETVNIYAQMMMLHLYLGIDGRLAVGTVKAVKPRFDPPLTPQKNWNFFLYRGEPLLVTRVLPHQVCRLDPSTGVATKLYSSKFPPLSKYKKKHGVKVHGGTGLIPWNETRYLGAFHIKKGRFPHGRYHTLWYLCESEPPFRIRFVSAPFCIDTGKPTVGERAESIQVATGLIDLGNEVLLTFGVMDSEMWSAKWNKVKLADWFVTHPLPLK